MIGHLVIAGGYAQARAGKSLAVRLRQSGRGNGGSSNGRENRSSHDSLHKIATIVSSEKIGIKNNPGLYARGQKIF
jgi:hypothetical protein